MTIDGLVRVFGGGFCHGRKRSECETCQRRERAIEHVRRMAESCDRVQALATRWEADSKPSGASFGFELSRASQARLETKRETLRECAAELADALAALDGAS